MQTTAATLKDVVDVYTGPEGQLWELIMGEQVHIGGLQSSLGLADAANIQEGSRGIDLCCCTGAGMRFLVRFRKVAGMIGVDATERMVELGKARCANEGFQNITFVLGDASQPHLPAGEADFVWGEDAWCYVEDKAALIAQAARVVKPGGTIAFTDWLECKGLAPDERERFLAFMKFPNMQTLEGYRALLEANGCEVLRAEETTRFAPCIDLYLKMVGMQLTYDALKIIGYDQGMLQAIAGEMQFAKALADSGKLIQGMIIARKKP